VFCLDEVLEGWSHGRRCYLWSEEVKGISKKTTEESGGREDFSFFMFREVLTIAMVYFFLCSSSRANATKGVISYVALCMKGNKIIISFLSAIRDRSFT